MTTKKSKTGLMAFLSKLFSDPDSKVVMPVNTKRSVSTETSPGDMSRQGYINTQWWQVDNERRAIFQDIENMDGNDEIVSQALDTIADTATGLEIDDIEGFYIHAQDGDVQEILNDLITRLDLKYKAWDIIRKMVKHGSEFREILVSTDPRDGKFKIMGLKEDLPPWQFYANLDKFGNQDAEHPWIQKAESGINGSKSIKFEPWQLVHWSFGPTKYRIAIPFLKSARRNWKRLQLVEDTMALARIIRAYVKLLHRVPVPPESNAKEQKALIDEYKKSMKSKDFLNWITGAQNQISTPLTVETDFYIPEDGSERGAIEAIDPKNPNLQNIDDVLYHLRRLVSRLGVPERYLNLQTGSSNAMNQSKGDNEEKHYARKIRSVQTAFKRGLAFICYIELILHNKNPMETQNAFTIHMAKVNGDDTYRKAQAENTNATAAKTYLETLEMPDEFIQKRFLGMSDYEILQYGGKVKKRDKPNPALQSNKAEPGGAPKGQRPGSGGHETSSGATRKTQSVIPFEEYLEND